MSDTRLGEPSAAIRERVCAAREQQIQRFAKRASGTRLLTNADMGAAEIRQHCALDPAGQRLMQAAMRQLQLSARGYHRVPKLARTIGDLAGVDAIGPAHLAEALQYRRGEASDRAGTPAGEDPNRYQTFSQQAKGLFLLPHSR